MYDDMGKQVHSQSKRTREYLIFEYYSKIVFSLMSMLEKVQSFDNKNNMDLSEVSSVERVIQEYVPPQGSKF